MVRWRDLDARRKHSLTFRSEDEAARLMQALNTSKPSLAGAFRVIRRQNSAAPTVGEVVQEHINLLVRPPRGSTRTYQRMPELHIQGPIGAIAVDAFGYQNIMLGVQSCTLNGVAPETIHNVHGLLSAVMTTAEMLGYISRKACRSVRLPPSSTSRTAQGSLLAPSTPWSWAVWMISTKPFVSFLVVTGTRFGEATALTVAGIDLVSRPPAVRINKAWKRDGHSQYYLGATKTGQASAPLA